jgi:HPt (histidine-containing phosphotransfer) domain-containing protein
VSLPSDLAAMTSVDASEGVHRVGGDAQTYRRLLQLFAQNYPNAIQELRRIMSQEGVLAAEHYCHAFKGVTGTVGAHPLYERVCEIDVQLKTGQPADEALLVLADKLSKDLLAEIASLEASH